MPQDLYGKSRLVQEILSQSVYGRNLSLANLVERVIGNIYYI